MDEREPKSETSKKPIDLAILYKSASSADEQTTKRDDGGHFLSATALVAAVAAVGLPLLRVKPVEAATESCPADSYVGYDIGDLVDCTDCLYSAVPVDCYVYDSNSGYHWGSGDHAPADIGDAPADISGGGDGGGCGDCGGCGGCGGCGDYYGS